MKAITARIGAMWNTIVMVLSTYLDDVSWYHNARISSRRKFIDKSFPRFLAYSFMPIIAVIFGLFLAVCAGLTVITAIGSLVLYLLGSHGVFFYVVFVGLGLISLAAFLISQED